jgi:hypothetical protein
MTAYTPGDILLVNDYTGSSDLLGNLIRAGERARYGDTLFSELTHCALIVSADGDLIEALANGIERSHIGKYTAAQQAAIISPPIPADDPRRAFAVAFAVAQLNDGYDVLDFIALASSLLTGLKVSVHGDGRFICSGLVSRATESYTEHGYPYPAEAMMPGDVAFCWGALADKPGPTPSFLGRLLDKLHAVCKAISPF